MKTRVVVAIPTFRRAELLERLISRLQVELESLNADQYEADVLVVDNDPDGSARDVADRLQSNRMRYVHEATPGISAARNRALDEAEGYDLLVFIDDDEMPDANWLNSLLETHSQSGAAAVAGAMVRDYPEPKDPWLEAGGFGVRVRHRTGTPLQVAPTSNLLLDLTQVRPTGIRFDERFGASGGEDSMFTRTVTRRGMTIVWCDEAMVHDFVPPERTTREWHLWRALSHGNGDGLIALAGSPGTLKLARRLSLGARGAVRILAGGARALVLGRIGRSLPHAARGQRTAMRGAGMLMSAFGMAYQEYAQGTRRRRWRRFDTRGIGTPTGHHPRSAQQKPLSVMLSFPPSKPRGNPYRALLEESIRAVPSVRVFNFRWRTALLGRYEVFHAHWPEILIAGSSPWKTWGKQALFSLWLARLALTRVAVVETIHNIDPPQGLSRAQTALLRGLRNLVVLRIRLNEWTNIPGEQSLVTILHGHYTDWYSKFAQPELIPGRIVFAGLVRRYKNVDGLLRAFRQTAGSRPDLTLHVLGRPSSDELRGSLEELAAPDARISLDLQYTPEQEFVSQVCAAELVVLPYREMHNSAAVLTALSLGRPVLVPDNTVNRHLRDEVGHRWVQMYEGELTGDAIIAALDKVHALTPHGDPDLSRRGWRDAGSDHVRAYERARAEVRAAAHWPWQSAHSAPLLDRGPDTHSQRTSARSGSARALESE